MTVSNHNATDKETSARFYIQIFGTPDLILLELDSNSNFISSVLNSNFVFPAIEHGDAVSSVVHILMYSIQ